MSVREGIRRVFGSFFEKPPPYFSAPPRLCERFCFAKCVRERFVILWRMSDPSANVTETDVRHVAKLSRLRLDDDEIRHFTEQLAHVMDYIAKINELDLEGVEPMAHALEMSNVLREDEPAPPLTVQAAMANAPRNTAPFFAVPKVLGEGPGA